MGRIPFAVTTVQKWYGKLSRNSQNRRVTSRARHHPAGVLGKPRLPSMFVMIAKTWGAGGGGEGENDYSVVNASFAYTD